MTSLLRYAALGFLGLMAVLVVVLLGQALVLAIGGPVFIAVLAWHLLKAVLAPARPVGQRRR